MPGKTPTADFLPRAQLQGLLDTLRQAGYRCVGPRVRDGAIVYDSLEDVKQLPHGLRDDQAPGRYRITDGESGRCFAWANGPQALKPLVFRPRETLWEAARGPDRRIRFTAANDNPEALAVIGARACDLAALRLSDAHFLREPAADPYYTARRAKLFLVGVDCTQPALTCFCVSTGDGPAITRDHDLALSELDDGFIIRAGSEQGEAILGQLPLQDAGPARIAAARHATKEAQRAQTRTLPGRNLRQALFARLEHPRWEAVAERCLSCGNCTQVCPTCFCHSEQEQPVLDGSGSVHTREWDSCFTQGHSYIHGLTIRADTHLRYRQWLTHKLGSWHEQYGRSGCVGCGRCISWCPVGIDITEETAAIMGGGVPD